MAEKKSDVLEPRFDGALIRNKYVKAGLFIVKTKAQRNEQIKTLYRELDGETTTLCYVSADRTIYELIANPSTAGTTDQDWEKLDFGVSDILVAKGNWKADNTDPVLTDTGASGNGNDFYIVSGAPTPVTYQDPSLFGGAEVTVKDGDWVISNGLEWFTNGAPITWDAISGIPTVVTEYVAGTIYDHQHTIDGVNGVAGLQTALDLKYDLSNKVDGTIDPATELDAALTDVLFVKTNYYSKGETYSQAEIDSLVGSNSPLSAKGDVYVHDGTVNARLPIGTDNQVLVADAAELLGLKWADAAETGWKTLGETVLTAPVVITHDHNEIVHDLGALELSGFSMIADLDTSLGTNIFRFNHQALSDHTEGFTEVYFGSNNGNQSSEAWGNIMFGQNNANSLLATGEWLGGRNIIGGFENGDGFSSLSTHNVIFGRRNASGAGELSYGVILGYEVLNGATSTAPDGKQNVIALGVWTMQNFAFNAEVGTEAYNANIIALGTETGADALSMYNAGNSGTDRGGAEASILLGTRAGYQATIERYEIFIGDNAGANAVAGRGNILIGTLAGASMTGGTAGNTGVGTTIYNTLVGTHAGEFLQGDKNSFFGTESGSSAIIGDFNAGFGNWALNRLTGNYNAAFGAYAGYNVVTPLTGDYNAFFGAGATYDSATPTFDNSIVIATNHTQLVVSDKIYLGSITQNVIFNGVLTQNDAETQIAVINSTTGELEYRDSASIAAPTAGIDGAIQYNTGGILDADNDFIFNSTNNSLSTATGSSHTASPRWSIITGDNNNTIGIGSGSLAWSAIFGDGFTFDNAGTSRSISNIMSLGYHNRVTIANGAFGVYSSAFLGTELTIEPALSGTNYQGTLVMGSYNTSRNGWQYVGGIRADVLGQGAFVHGQGELINRLFSDGNWSINMSSNTVAQTYGHGANAINSAIIGGIDAHIPADSLRSVVIGGSGLKMPAATPDTVLVENLMVNGIAQVVDTSGFGGFYLTAAVPSGIDLNYSVNGLGIQYTHDYNPAFPPTDTTTSFLINPITRSLDMIFDDNLDITKSSLLKFTPTEFEMSLGDFPTNPDSKYLKLQENNYLFDMQVYKAADDYNGQIRMGASIVSIEWSILSNRMGFEWRETGEGIKVLDEHDSAGMYYSDNYSTNGIAAHGDLWITDKGYADNHLGGQLLDALVVAPTATEDGFHVAWNDTNQEYELASGAAPSTDYWKTAGTSVFTAAVDFTMPADTDDAVSWLFEDTLISDSFKISMSSSILGDWGILIESIANNGGTSFLPVIKYGGDHSDSFDAHTLVTKEYVELLVPSAGNGLTDFPAGTFGLGGLMTRDTSFTGGNWALNFGTGGTVGQAFNNIQMFTTGAMSMRFNLDAGTTSDYFIVNQLSLVDPAFKIDGDSNITIYSEEDKFSARIIPSGGIMSLESVFGVVKYDKFLITGYDDNLENVVDLIVQAKDADYGIRAVTEQGSLQLTNDTTAFHLFTDVTNTPSGLRYAAAGYVTDDRSLVDKGYADGAYWKTIGTTDLTGDVSIEGGTATFKDIEIIQTERGFSGTQGGYLSMGGVVGAPIVTLGVTGSAFTGKESLLTIKNDTIDAEFKYTSDSPTGKSVINLQTSGAADIYRIEIYKDIVTPLNSQMVIGENPAGANATGMLFDPTGITMGSRTDMTLVSGEWNVTNKGFLNIRDAGTHTIDIYSYGTAATELSGYKQRVDTAGGTSSHEWYLRATGSSNRSLIFDTLEGLHYDGDMSSFLGTNSLIPKNYADGAYWKTTGTTNLTGANIDVLLPNLVASILQLGDSTGGSGQGFSVGQNVTNEGYALHAGNSSLGEPFGIAVDINNVTGLGAPANSMFIYDTRATTRGLEYLIDYSSGFTARSLIDKGFADSHIGGQLVDALVEAPTATEDGKVIAWNDTNQEYELITAGGGGGWRTDAGTTTLGAGEIHISAPTGGADLLTVGRRHATGASTDAWMEVQDGSVYLITGDWRNTSDWDALFLSNSWGSSIRHNTATGQSSIDFNASGLTLEDSIGDVGARYAADYSTAGAALGARWIPDKGYNDATYVSLLGDDTDQIIDNNADGKDWFLASNASQHKFRFEVLSGNSGQGNISQLTQHDNVGGDIGKVTLTTSGGVTISSGVEVDSTETYGLQITSSGGYILAQHSGRAALTGVDQPFRVRSLPTGAPTVSVGYGTSIVLDGQANGWGWREMAHLETSWLVPSNSTRTSDYKIYTYVTGTKTLSLNVGGTVGTGITTNADPDTNLTDAVDGVIAYDSTGHEFRAYVNGAWAALGGGSSAGVVNRAQTSDGSGAFKDSGFVMLDSLVNGAANGVAFDMTVDVTQTSTSSYKIFNVAITETTTGSGNKDFMFFTVGGATKYQMKSTGDQIIYGNIILGAGDEGILDSNEIEMLTFSESASSENHFEMTNSDTGSAPALNSIGTDANIDLILKPKGTGVLVVDTGIRLDTTQVIHTVHLLLTSAQIKDLNTTPIELVAAQGAGKYIQVIGGSVDYEFLTAGYATASTLRLKYASNNILWEIQTFIDAAGSSTEHFAAIAGVSATANQALQVTADADATGTGTGVMDVYVQYVVIDTN